MTPDKLASYARVLFTYSAAAAATAGAGYEMVIGHFDNPLVGIALTLVGAVTGYHLAGGSASPDGTAQVPPVAAPAPAIVPVAPVVVTPPAPAPVVTPLGS